MTDSTYSVTIEIPRGGRNKYEVDHVTGRIRLDRTLFTAFVYPVDYGFIDDTLGKDYDPLDALVLLAEPAFPGVYVSARAIGVFKMTDENGEDAKIVMVPATDPRWASFRDIDDVPLATRQEIEHFFTHYKDLEAAKFVTVDGFGDVVEAEAIIAEAVAAFAAVSHDKN